MLSFCFYIHVHAHLCTYACVYTEAQTYTFPLRNEISRDHSPNSVLLQSVCFAYLYRRSEFGSVVHFLSSLWNSFLILSPPPFIHLPLWDSLGSTGCASHQLLLAWIQNGLSQVMLKNDGWLCFPWRVRSVYTWNIHCLGHIIRSLAKSVSHKKQGQWR